MRQWPARRPSASNQSQNHDSFQLGSAGSKGWKPSSSRVIPYCDRSRPASGPASAPAVGVIDMRIVGPVVVGGDEAVEIVTPRSVAGVTDPQGAARVHVGA